MFSYVCWQLHITSTSLKVEPSKESTMKSRGAICGLYCDVCSLQAFPSLQVKLIFDSLKVRIPTRSNVAKLMTLTVSGESGQVRMCHFQVADKQIVFAQLHVFLQIYTSATLYFCKCPLANMHLANLHQSLVSRLFLCAVLCMGRSLGTRLNQKCTSANLHFWKCTILHFCMLGIGTRLFSSRIQFWSWGSDRNEDMVHWRHAYAKSSLQWIEASCNRHRYRQSTVITPPVHARWGLIGEPEPIKVYRPRWYAKSPTVHYAFW